MVRAPCGVERFSTTRNLSGERWAPGSQGFHTRIPLEGDKQNQGSNRPVTIMFLLTTGLNPLYMVINNPSPVGPPARVYRKIDGGHLYDVD